jgi:hypothetical protein
MSMDFPATPTVGDVHAFTNDKDRKTNFEWDGITWNRMDGTPSSPAPPAPHAGDAKPTTVPGTAY